MTFPSEEKELKNNRRAYWDDSTQVIVIEEPGDTDGGTAFRPDDGKAYFDRTR